MSLLSEIEANRARILDIQEARRIEDIIKFKTSDQLPPGFYTPQQLERFTKSNELIYDTTQRFMREINFSSYRLDREFRVVPQPLIGTRNETAYFFRSGVGLEQLGNEVRMPYHPGGRSSSETLGIHYDVPVLVPEKNKNNGEYDPAQLVAWLKSPDATYISHPVIRAYGPLTEQKIRDLLTLVVSNPKFSLLTAAV